MDSFWTDENHTDPRRSQTALRDRLARNAAGQGGLVLLTGGATSGKTHLVGELLNQAAASGAITLCATGSREEQHLGSGILEQLFSSQALPDAVADRVAALLDGPVPDAADPVPDVVAELCRVVMDLTRGGPVVLTVDDLQFAEDDALRLLLRLHRRIRSTRLLMVLAIRDRPNSTHLAMRARFARQSYDSIRLAPWSPDAVQGQAAAAGLADAEARALDLHALSGGNPLLVSALIEDGRAGDPARPGTGPAFAHAVRAVLHRLDPAVRELAGAAVLLDAVGDVAAAARLAGVGVSEAKEALEMLTDAGVFGPDGVRHPSVRSAVLDCLAPETLSRFHAAAAEHRLRANAPEHEVAAHLVEADAPVPAWGIPILLAAARQAAGAEQNTFARRCLEAALQACDDPAQIRGIRTALAEIAWQSNPSAAATYLSAPSEPAHLDPAHPGRAHPGPAPAEAMMALRCALWDGDQAGAEAALEALKNQPEPLTPQLEAEIDLALQWHFGPAAGRLAARLAADPAQGDPWHRAAAAVAQLWTHGGSEVLAQNAERMLRNSRLSSLSLETLATSVLALAHSNRGDAAAKWCATLSRQAEARGAATWQALIDTVWALVSARRGDPAAALERARSALAALGPRGWGTSVFFPLSALAVAHTALGDFDAAAAALDVPRPDPLPATVGALRFLRARGQLHLTSSRVLAAVSDFGECGRLLAAQQADHPALLPWRSDLAEAYLWLGNTAAARDLARQQLDLAADTDAASQGHSLRILALLSRPVDRPAMLSQAADWFKKSGDQLELGRTVKTLSQLHLRHQQGDFGPGHSVWIPEQRRTPAPVPVPRPVREVPAAARDGGAETPGGPAAPEILSEAELRVAELAALGWSNRQIGNNLFITVSTVEQHLTRVYRKLQVSGRSDLAGRLASQAG